MAMSKVGVWAGDLRPAQLDLEGLQDIGGEQPCVMHPASGHTPAAQPSVGMQTQSHPESGINASMLGSLSCTRKASDG